MSKQEMPSDIIQGITFVGFFGFLILGVAISIYGGQTAKYEYIVYAIFIFPLAFIPLGINLYRQKRYKKRIAQKSKGEQT